MGYTDQTPTTKPRLTYCVLRSTQPPTLSGIENKYGLRDASLVPQLGAVVCLMAAPRIQLLASTGNEWPHNGCGIISSCQSAATSEIVKRLWSRV